MIHDRTWLRFTAIAILWSTTSGAFAARAAESSGRIAEITRNNTGIYGEPALRSLRSICSKGQHVVVLAESKTEYELLMANGAPGFVLKASVRLLPFSTSIHIARSSALGQTLVRTAETYLGVPYLWGGTTTQGIDCSGFVQAVYRQNGISLPRVARDQVNIGSVVNKFDVGSWVPGDRLYFACHHGRVIDHTAMYVGNGYFIHASVGHGGHVAIDPVANRYYYAHLIDVRHSPELGQLTWTRPTSPEKPRIAKLPNTDPDSDTVASPEQSAKESNPDGDQSADAIATAKTHLDPIYASLVSGDYQAVIRKTQKTKKPGQIAMRAIAMLKIGSSEADVTPLIIRAIDGSVAQQHSTDRALAVIANGVLQFKRYQKNPSIDQIQYARSQFDEAVIDAPNLELGQMELAETNAYIDPSVATQNIRWAEDIARRNGHPQLISVIERLEARIFQ